MSGVDGSTSYLVHTNLTGAYNCLELARESGARIVFLSTSRVYPVATLLDLELEEGETRFELAAEQATPGVSAAGISEATPLGGARTLYGTTKLAAELLIEEYRAAFGLSAVVDRFGVIAGPWQMGKVDQGVFTHWMLSHHFGLPLSYIGFGGAGKQVRDLIHVDDAVDLIERQLLEPERWDGLTLNVGGGREGSLSLLETTDACRRLTGREVEIGSDPDTRPGDVPLYISDCAALLERTDWRPAHSAEATLADIAEWIGRDEERLAATLGLDVSGKLKRSIGNSDHWLWGHERGTAMTDGMYDPLTGLPARALLMDRIQQAIYRSARSGDPIAIFVLDLEALSRVGQALGGDAAEALLREVAINIRNTMRRTDTVARLGELRLAVVCEAPDRGIATIVERVSRVTSETLDLGEGSPDRIDSVIGIAFADGNIEPAEALERAESAREQSRELGRDHLLFREPGAAPPPQ